MGAGEATVDGDDDATANRRPGPLALVGGDELKPGNEEQDEILAAAAAEGPAFVLATAAGRQRPELAVAHAKVWFARFGLDVEELPAVRPADVRSQAGARRAREGRFFYLVGGDPGRVPTTLARTPVWNAVLGAWRAGAALAGSSAGAMALGEWTLIRDRHPGDASRLYRPALAVVPRVAVIPHFDGFGEGWVDGALRSKPSPDAVILGIDERSAALWRGGEWRALGPGAVTVLANGERHRSASGERIETIPQPVVN
jgi:cyanophycinase